MKIAIVGYGKDGQAAAQYWLRKGWEVVIHDQDSTVTPPAGVRAVTGPDYLVGLDRYDLIFRSANVCPDSLAGRVPQVTVLNEFAEHCPCRIIGVTGTRGKSTTVALIARILGEAGIRTHTNSHVSPLAFLPKVRANHIAVLEMSSRALMDLSKGPHVAVCLAVAGAGAGWHKSTREYVAATGNIFWHQRADDVAVFDGTSEYAVEIAQLSPGQKLAYGMPPGAYLTDGRIRIGQVDICATDELGMPGGHNVASCLAAVTACWGLVGENPAPIARALTGFTGLPHRLERVNEVAGVNYFDDALATTADAVTAAAAAFAGPKVMIIGGDAEVADFSDAVKELGGLNVRQVILVGESAGTLKKAFERVKYHRTVMASPAMADIVTSARAVAMPGDTVVFSPGVSSSNESMGDEFQAAVMRLR